MKPSFRSPETGLTTLRPVLPQRFSSPSRRWVVVGVLLATGAVLVLLGDRGARPTAVGQKADFGLCAKLKGEAARSCYQSEVGRELASVGATAGAPAIRLAAPADSRAIGTFTAPPVGDQPLLCALHTRVGVTSDDVPGWLSWTQPAVPVT